jgi:hypothetical protein
MHELGRESNVSASYAKKVIDELTTMGCLRNPCITRLDKNVTHGIGLDFTIEEEVFLLALRMDCPFHPNTDYAAKLKDYYDCDKSSSQISVWFKTRFEYVGSYKVLNLVPIDKWMMQNATRVMAFHAIMDMFPDHSHWIFRQETYCQSRLFAHKGTCQPTHQIC